MPTILSWLLAEGEQSADRRCVQAGKELILQWTSGDPAPPAFFIREGRGNLWNRAANKLGIFGTPPTILVVPAPGVPGRARGDRPWPAGSRGAARQASYYFDDGSGHRSPYVTSSLEDYVVRYKERQADLTFDPKLKVHAPLLGDFEASALNMGVGRRTVVHSVGACRDPDLKLDLLLPWEEGELNLTNHLARDFSELSGRPISAAEVRQRVGEALPSQRPSGLEIWVEPSSVFVDASSEVDVVVNIQAFDSARHASFALRASDPAGGYVIGPVVEFQVA